MLPTGVLVRSELFLDSAGSDIHHTIECDASISLGELCRRFFETADIDPPDAPTIHHVVCDSELSAPADPTLPLRDFLSPSPTFVVCRPDSDSFPFGDWPLLSADDHREVTVHLPSALITLCVDRDCTVARLRSLACSAAGLGDPSSFCICGLLSGDTISLCAKARLSSSSLSHWSEFSLTPYCESDLTEVTVHLDGNSWRLRVPRSCTWSELTEEACVACGWECDIKYQIVGNHGRRPKEVGECRDFVMERKKAPLTVTVFLGARDGPRCSLRLREPWTFAHVRAAACCETRWGDPGDFEIHPGCGKLASSFGACREFVLRTGDEFATVTVYFGRYPSAGSRVVVFRRRQTLQELRHLLCWQSPTAYDICPVVGGDVLDPGYLTSPLATFGDSPIFVLRRCIARPDRSVTVCVRLDTSESQLLLVPRDGTVGDVLAAVCRRWPGVVSYVVTSDGDVLDIDSHLGDHRDFLLSPRGCRCVVVTASVHPGRGSESATFVVRPDTSVGELRSLIMRETHWGPTEQFDVCAVFLDGHTWLPPAAPAMNLSELTRETHLSVVVRDPSAVPGDWDMKRKKGVSLYELTHRYPLIGPYSATIPHTRFDCVFVDGQCDNVEWVIDWFRPTSLLVLALEGNPPALKRRLHGIKDRNIHTDSIATIADKVARRLPGLTIVVTESGSAEAEHNVFDFIRRQREQGQWNEDATCCICTPDVDCLFLALHNNVNHCCLCSTTQHTFIYVDVLREYLLLEFGSHFIDDFVFISFFFGNDFITPFVALCSWTNAIRKYREDFAPSKRFLVADNSNLSDFLECLSDEEPAPERAEVGESALDQISWIYSYYKTGIIDREWLPESLAPVHVKTVARAARTYRRRLLGKPKPNDFLVLVFRAGNSCRVRASEVRFQWQRPIRPGTPPCYPSLLDFRPSEFVLPVGADRPIRVRQVFPIKTERIGDVVHRIVLAGWPYLLPAKVVQVVNEKRVVDCTVEELAKRGIDAEGTRAVFAVNFVCLIDGLLAWNTYIDYVPVDLVLPVDITNTIDRFREIDDDVS
jgi:hypothetical protein